MQVCFAIMALRPGDGRGSSAPWVHDPHVGVVVVEIVLLVSTYVLVVVVVGVVVNSCK